MSSRQEFPVPLNQLDVHQQVFNAQEHLAYKPASLPVPNSTYSFWLHPSNEVNPLAKEGSSGDFANDADICIIGSGITGVSAAYHISKNAPEKKVVVLEARDFCSGATGRNGGHLTAGRFLGLVDNSETMGLEEALKQYALEQHVTDSMLELIKDNNLDDIVDLVSGGHLDMIFSDKEEKIAQADFNLAKKSGVDLDLVNWLTKEEMIKLYGTPYPAIFYPGNNLWPLKLVTQMYYLAKAKFSESGGSLDLYTSTPVLKVVPSDVRRWSAVTPRGSVSCSSVLHATNGYASHLLPFYAGPHGIVPVRGQVLATRAAVPIPASEHASFGGNEGFEYWFLRPSKTDKDEKNPLAIIGGGRETTTGYELGVTDDSTVSDEAGKTLRRFLPRIYPGKYDEQEPDMEWTGIMGYTSIHDPFVGPVRTSDGEELEGQYISAGYTGHGMPRAYGCAEAVSSIILHDLSGKSREEWIAPSWIPKRYFTWNR